MPPPRRIARLQQLILETAATTVQRSLADPRLGFVTITRVKLAPDLSEATVYWSGLGTEAQRRTSTRALSAATPLIQREVARVIGTRVTPRLTLRYDPTLVNAERLEGIFETIKKERPAAPETEAAKAKPSKDDDKDDDDEKEDDDEEEKDDDEEGDDEDDEDDEDGDEDEDEEDDDEDEAGREDPDRFNDDD